MVHATNSEEMQATKATGRGKSGRLCKKKHKGKNHVNHEAVMCNFSASSFLVTQLDSEVHLD